MNSDSPNNKGDRAILSGAINLIRSRWPSAEIWALSEHQIRDQAWFGINFLPYSPYTVNPIALTKISLLAKNCDVVFWGGGELLKDYTNKIGLVYWLLRVLLIVPFNKNIFGLFQGIGPTRSWIGKLLIVKAVNLTKCFIVRDDESKKKLISWCAKVPIIASFDPAVLNVTSGPADATLRIIDKEFDIDLDFLNNSIGIGVRKWFHYDQRRWIPYRFRSVRRKAEGDNIKLSEYAQNMARLLDELVKIHNVNVVFFPMFNSKSEGDDSFSQNIISRMERHDRARVIDGDILSPKEFSSIISRCKIFIASRLHSAIIATSCLVPSFGFYYVDKGRVYFSQIGMDNFSLPIEALLSDNSRDMLEKIGFLIQERARLEEVLKCKIDQIRAVVHGDFNTMMDRYCEQ